MTTGASRRWQRALGRNEDYEHFRKRGRNYVNVFDSRIGYMAPKTADGNFVPGFDPKTSGGLGGREYFRGDEFQRLLLPRSARHSGSHGTHGRERRIRVQAGPTLHGSVSRLEVSRSWPSSRT